jgi:integrase
MARYTTTDPVTGLPARKSLYGRSEQEARTRLIQALADDANGRLPFARGRAITLGQFVARGLMASQVRAKTGLRYRELLEQHVLPTLGRVPLPKLEPSHVDGLIRAKHAAGVASKTCNHIRGTLRSCLNDALREGLVSRNVAALARPLKVDDARESVILTPDQIPVLLRVADDHRDGALWVVALATGARQSELLGLRWGDIDLENRTIRIVKTLQRTPLPLRAEHGEWLEQPTKTRRSTRVVPLARVAVKHLQKQRARQAQDRGAAGRAWREEYGDLVFRGVTGAPVSGNHLSRSLQRALDEHGLPTIRFHDLRHAAATFLAVERIPVAVTMAVLGHSNASTTLEIYTKVAPELAREAAEAMDRVLGRGAGEPVAP